MLNSIHLIKYLIYNLEIDIINTCINFKKIEKFMYAFKFFYIIKNKIIYKQLDTTLHNFTFKYLLYYFNRICISLTDYRTMPSLDT